MIFVINITNIDIFNLYNCDIPIEVDIFDSRVMKKSKINCIFIHFYLLEKYVMVYFHVLPGICFYLGMYLFYFLYLGSLGDSDHVPYIPLLLELLCQKQQYHPFVGS